MPSIFWSGLVVQLNIDKLLIVTHDAT